MTDAKLAKRTYSPDERRQALIALLVTGSSTTASQQTGVPRSTLEKWRSTEHELWAHLNREHGPTADSIIAAELRGAVRTAASIENQLLERLEANATRIDPRDLPAAIKNIQAAKSSNVDKLLVITGRANTIVEMADARDIIADIAKMFRPYIDSTGEESA